MALQNHRAQELILRLRNRLKLKIFRLHRNRHLLTMWTPTLMFSINNQQIFRGDYNNNNNIANLLLENSYGVIYENDLSEIHFYTIKKNI